ncbi:MAG: hypothetical protein D3907_05810 [Candidatus Electrothrix sp. AUS3]|nr:hypothetical protein [Candidatus Electrothrix gigas]
MCTCTLQTAERHNIEELKTNRFTDIKKIIKNSDIMHVNNEHDLMFCSPVGNQHLFHHDAKANFVLSGFCVAPDAGIKFLKDLQRSQESAACDNTFNTPNMRSGIKKIFKSIGIKKFETLFDMSMRSPEKISKKNKGMNLMMTQLLCMISPGGSSQAIQVMKLLRSDDGAIFKKQAEQCLCHWVQRIKENVKEGSPILLMGKDALTLLNKTAFDSQSGEYKCTMMLGQKNNLPDSLYAYMNRKYSILPVIHASGINYKKNEERWYEKSERRQVHKVLLNKLGDHHIDIQAPVLMTGQAT